MGSASRSLLPARAPIHAVYASTRGARALPRLRVECDIKQHMLKNLTSLHTPELLHTLASMGHGDDIVVVDAHFPAVSMAQRLVRLDGVSGPAALDAILQLIPLDTFVDDPALRMEVVGKPDEVPEVQKEFQAVITNREGKPSPLAKVERFAFYERAKKAFAIVVTGELRPYGCVIIKKGIVI